MQSKMENHLKVRELLVQVLKSPPIMVKGFGLRLSSVELRRLGAELVPYVMRFISAKKHNILEVLDIEDNYWNPVYGLKGKLDATVRYQTKRGTQAVNGNIFYRVT